MRRALARLKQHWVRHLLAALQVAVGVAVVTAVFVDVVPVLFSRDARHENTLFRVVYGTTYPYESRWSVFTLDDVAYVESEVDSVVAASVYENEYLALLRVNGDLYMARSYARVSPGFEQVAGVRLIAGRFFDESDAAADEPSVAVISSELAEALFPGQSALGQVINIRPRPEAHRIAGFTSRGSISTEGAPGLDVRVIGIFERPEGTPTYAGFFAGTIREEMLLPATGRISRALSGIPQVVASPLAGEGAAGPIVAPEQEYAELYVRAADRMGREVVAEIEALLGSRIDARQSSRPVRDPAETPSLVITPVASGAESTRQSQLTGNLLLGAMGIAALIVAGFSIFTTFLATVAERVRMIGIARALGATRLRIVREIVGEAVTLTFIGGLIGVALSYPVRAFVFRPLMGSVQSPGAIDVAVTVAGALLLAVGVGALAALYPGWTVARMSPSEAFHEE